jgi:hypothetical protein
MTFSVLFKPNGLLARVLLSSCSVREQPNVGEKRWQKGERKLRKTGGEAG